MRLFISLTILSALLAGCIQKEIVDDVNLETGAAYDYTDGKNTWYRLSSRLFIG